MGFKFTRRGRNSLIHERQDLIGERAKFIRIREIKEKEPHRKIVYTDETWINENHCLKKEWVDLESIQNPYRSLKDCGTVGEAKAKCGKEKRLIIITDTITAEEPIKDALWIFKASKTSKEKNVKRGQLRKECPEDAEEDKKATG